MIVYANHFQLRPQNGLNDIFERVASWISRSRDVAIDPHTLALGIREYRMKEGATLSSTSTRNESGDVVYPFSFCASLKHPDPKVSGRRWVAEVGLKQSRIGDPIECSVLLQTEEISARVTSPIKVTCPRIVRDLVEQCNPIDRTPSRDSILLTETNAKAFAYEIERETRDYPLVIVSREHDGTTPISSSRLRQLLVGLAQVIEIPATADSYALEEILGRRYTAFGGAVRVILPYRKTVQGDYCATSLIPVDALKNFLSTDADPESELLSIVTHRTNIPNSWKHVSMEMVKQEVLRARLRQAAVSASKNSDLSAYEELLEEAAANLDVKDSTIEGLREDLKSLESSLDQTQAEIDNLKHALQGASSRSDFDPASLTESLAPLRQLVLSAISEELTLEGVLRLISMLFPERVIVLDSALTSARESDRGDFQHCTKALELLLLLCTSYWEALVRGEGDQGARNVFGKNGFAAKEAEGLSKDGKDRRTFVHRGKIIFMERHLKHGVKDSLSETLRVHFAWIGEHREIAIGHCGKHLDF